jgi:hypothetical protein
MKRFECSCGQAVFFHNSSCTRCGVQLGFDPASLTPIALQGEGDELRDDAGERYRTCRNTRDYGNCNWLVAAEDTDDYCVACRLNRTIPNFANPTYREYWNLIEDAKRRLVYALLGLHLPVLSQTRGWPHGLAFDFIEDHPHNQPADRVLTQHANGVITINVAEADEVMRTMSRRQMNERYRTLLGRFRHESAHYYFDHLLQDPMQRTAFRILFGDEHQDYARALADYYASGPPPDWEARHISAYAAAHPAEDWAETWAHYLHMHDCLETAVAHRLVEPSGSTFDDLLSQWQEFSVALNELNRSIGLSDAYPFVISPPVAGKLRFVHELLRAR